MTRQRADRLAVIRDQDDLEDALAVAPDPSAIPRGFGEADVALWQDYCRYYRRRLEAIGEDVSGGRSPKLSPPRSFTSYQQVIARRGKVRRTAGPSASGSGDVGSDERTFPKAVIPPREPGQDPSLPERGGPAFAGAESPDSGSLAGHGNGATPGSGLPILGMSAREIMAQIECDVDAAVERAPGAVIKLEYDGGRVPIELRPAMLEYAQHYARERWSQLVHIAY